MDLEQDLYLGVDSLHLYSTSIKKRTGKDKNTKQDDEKEI